MACSTLVPLELAFSVGNDEKNGDLGCVQYAILGRHAWSYAMLRAPLSLAPNGMQSYFVANATVPACKATILDCIRVLC